MRSFAASAALLALFALSAVPPRAALAEDDKPDPIDETRGYIGYSAALVGSLEPDQKKEMRITRDQGIYVAMVVLGSPARKAGLEVGDVILKIQGKDAPDTSKVDAKDPEAVKRFLKEDLKAITHAVKPGDAVEMVVDRAGTTTTVKAVALSKKEYDEVVAEAEEEANAVPVPDPTKSGPANAASYGFEGLAEGKDRPDDVLSVTGYWEVVEEADKSKNHVLSQHSDMENDRAFALVTGDGRSLTDGTVSVRLAPRAGMKAVGGGLVFRVRDRKHFYAAALDGVAKTLRVYRVAKKEVKVLVSVEVPSPKLKEWHTLELTLAGPKFTVVLDGSTKVEAADPTYPAGWAGPLTEQDAESFFDDLKLTPK